MDKFAAVATSEHDDACFVLRAETSGSPLVSMPLTLPVPVTGELLLTVEYSDVNPVDYQKLHGSRGFPLIPGFGGAGRVRTVPVADQLTSAFSPGDRVAFLASPSGGSFASHALVSSQLCCRLPDVLPLAIAAALPVAGVTAYEALFDRLELPRFRSPNIWGDDDGDERVARDATSPAALDARSLSISRAHVSHSARRRSRSIAASSRNATQSFR